MAAFLFIPAAGGDLAVSYVSGIGDGGANGTSHSYAGAALGAEAADREIFVVIIASRGGSLNTTISSASIGGVAATIETPTTISGGVGGAQVFMFHAQVPSGTTGTVAVTFAHNVGVKGLGVYRVTGRAVAGAAASDFAFAQNTGTSTTQNVTGVDVPAGGAALLGTYMGTSSRTVTGATSPNLTWATYNISYGAPNIATGFCAPSAPAVAAETVTVAFNASPGLRTTGIWTIQ